MRSRKQNLLVFSGVPLNDSATLYRTGLMAKKFLGLGYRIKVISVNTNFTKVRSEKINGLEVTYIGQAHYFAARPFSQRQRLSLLSSFRENILTVKRFKNIVSEEKPDWVLTVTTLPVSLMAGVLAKLSGSKTVVDIEDLASGQMEAAGYPKILTGLYRLTERLGLLFFDKKVVCSSYLKSLYRGSIVIPNMIETASWKKSKGRELLRKKWRIVFVGQAGAYHGQAELLQELIPYLKKRRNVEVTLIGGGEALNSLKLLVKSGRLGKQLTLTGHLPQEKVKKLVARADIGLLPMWDTPVHRARHPLKLLEYLAASLVVITNKVGEAGRIVKNRVNGYCCSAGDMKSVVKAIEVITGDPELIGKISRQAEETAWRFDTAKIIPLWKKVFEI